MPNTPAPCLNSIRDFCDEPTLVAYAPYDEEGELKLYQTGSSSLSPSWSGGNLSFSGVSGGSGVIVGTPSGYLQYNLGSLGLGNSFSIEMSVRGGALKANGTHYLFTNSDVYLNLFNGDLNLWYYSAWFHPVVTISSWSLNWLINNKFYPIKATLSGTSWKIDIPGLPASLWTWITKSLTGQWAMGNFNSSQQWNDIINYIKLYNN